MKLRVVRSALLLSVLSACAPRAQSTPRYALPEIDGKQYMTLQVGADQQLVVAVDAVWSCTARVCSRVLPPVGNRPAPGHCPCTNIACRDVCDPGPLGQLSPPTLEAPTRATTAP